jgi:hypothetical protein
MRNFRAKILVLCGLMIVVAGTLTPFVVQASCPDLIVSCPNGGSRMCRGSSDGNGHCVYSESCVSCAPRTEELAEVESGAY